MKTPIQLTQDKVTELAKSETDQSKSIILAEVFGHLALMEELEKQVIMKTYDDGWESGSGQCNLKGIERMGSDYYNEKFK